MGSLALLPWMINDCGPLRDGATLCLIAWLGLAATAVAYRLFSASLAWVRVTAA